MTVTGSDDAAISCTSLIRYIILLLVITVERNWACLGGSVGGVGGGGGGGICCPPNMRCAPTVPQCSVSSFSGGGCDHSSCGAGGSFAAPGVVAPPQFGNFFLGQPAPIATNYNGGGGASISTGIHGGGGGAFYQASGIGGGGSIYPNGGKAIYGHNVNVAGIGSGSYGAAPLLPNIAETTLPVPAGTQSGYNDNPIETAQKLPVTSPYVSPLVPGVLPQSSSGEAAAAPYQQLSVDNVYEEIVSSHVDNIGSISTTTENEGAIQESSAVGKFGDELGSYREQASSQSIVAGKPYFKKLEPGLAQQLQQPKELTPSFVPEKSEFHSGTEPGLATSLMSYESQETAALAGGSSSIGDSGSGTEIRDETAQQEGYGEQGGGTSESDNGVRGKAVRIVEAVGSGEISGGGGAGGTGYEEHHSAQQLDISIPSSTSTTIELNAESVDTASNTDITNSGGYDGMDTNAIIDSISVETDASTCNDPHLRAIVEAALNEEHDNLDAARKIEGEASKRFGGRFNSIVSDSEFAYVNWYGKRNCQLRVRGRHSLTWED